ncbi:MAG: hypothetical protein COS89_02025, partial [Deltaproteobacteria bacterium CG07_land_8_20_14_0_80_38_7]
AIKGSFEVKTLFKSSLALYSMTAPDPSKVVTAGGYTKEVSGEGDKDASMDGVGVTIGAGEDWLLIQ